MRKKLLLKPFIIGVITYFIITIILNIFGANTAVNRFAIFALIILVGSVIKYFYNKSKS